MYTQTVSVYVERDSLKVEYEKKKYKLALKLFRL